MSCFIRRYERGNNFADDSTTRTTTGWTPSFISPRCAGFSPQVGDPTAADLCVYNTSGRGVDMCRGIFWWANVAPRLYSSTRDKRPDA